MTTHSLDAPDVLTDGEWRVDRGIQRWFPAPRLISGPPSVALLIACPFCRAKVSETCRSAGGNPVLPHKSRLAPRLCRCGALLRWKKQMCPPCAATARQQTYLLRELREPTRTRRRAAA